MAGNSTQRPTPWLNGERSDRILTYGAEGLVLVATLLVYRLAAKGGGADLDAYVVVRRTLSFVQPLLLMGLAVGLPRMVAMANARGVQRAYLLAALRLVGITGALGVILALVLPEELARFTFGNSGLAHLMPPLATMALGLSLHAVGYSFLRGRQLSAQANVLQVVGLALVPVLAFLSATSLDAVLWTTGLAWCLAPLVVIIPEVLAGPFTIVREQRAQLLRYGLPRIPGDLAYAGLFTVPVLWVAHTHGSAVAGQVGLGITLLNLVGAAFAPISLLMLPRTAALLKARAYKDLLQRIAQLERLSLLGATSALLLVEGLMPWLLELYLPGIDTSLYLMQCRLIFLAAPALAYFIALRSVLDAYHTSPRNGINLMVAFITILIFLFLATLVSATGEVMGGSVVVATLVLGWRTWRDVRALRAELQDRASTRERALRVLLVIPGTAQGNELPFSRRQGKAMAEQHGAQVGYFFLSERLSILGLWRARLRLLKQIRTERPDVVHAHYGTITAFFTVLSSPVPLVVTFHGSDLNPTPSDGRVRDLAGRVLSQFAAFFAAGIICVSEGLRARLWWRREEARILPMGVDLQQFVPMDRADCRRILGWPAHGKVILFNANNPALKRLDLARLTVERLDHAGSPVRLHVLEGGVDPTRMPLFLNASDALLLCSDREGSPTMVKEAMACELPVVSSDVGDVRERLRDVTPGAVVRQDVTELAEALRIVLLADQRSNGRKLADRNGIDSAAIDAETFKFLRSLVDR